MIEESRRPAGAPAPSATRTRERPAIDVVVPFLGSSGELAALHARLAALRLGPGDTVTILDNTPASVRSGPAGAGAPEVGGVAPESEIAVAHADERLTPGFARNRGADRGRAEWLVFLDADAAPAPDLLDRYFDPRPGPRVGLIGGGVIDEVVTPDAGIALRYAHIRGAMSQDDTFSFGEWGYPKSANIACRRSAFEQIGGFREDIRAGKDADLTYRLRAAGWQVERREEALAVHLSRTTVRSLLRQKAQWGAGGAWLARAYPGSVPLAKGPGLAWWALRETTQGLLLALRRRDRDAAIYAVMRPLEALAWETGRRLLSNERARRH